MHVRIIIDKAVKRKKNCIDRDSPNYEKKLKGRRTPINSRIRLIAIKISGSNTIDSRSRGRSQY